MKINRNKKVSGILKITAGIILFILLVFVLIKVVILIPSVQNKLKNKVAAVLNENLRTEVSIGKIDIHFPKKVAVTDFFISGNENDTLVYVGDFSVSARILPLLKHRIVLSEIEIKNSKGDIGKLIGQIPTEPETSVKDQTESVPWEIDVNALELKNIYFKYRDHSAKGFELILDLGKAYAEIGYINFDTLIKFSYLETENAFVSYQDLSTVESEDDSTFSFADIRADKTNLQNSGFSFIDSAAAVSLHITGKEIKTNDLLLDLTGSSVILGEAATDELFIEIRMIPEEEKKPQSKESLNWGKSLSNWHFRGNELKVRNTRVKIDNVGTPDPRGHFNSDHLDFNELNGTLSDFLLANNTLGMKIQNLSGKEMNGFDVVQLDAEIHTSPTEFSIKKFKMKTESANYNVQLRTTISPTNYLDIKNKILNIDLDIKCKTWDDIDYFSSALDENPLLVKNFIRNPFWLQTKITGNTNDLDIENFEFAYLDSSRILANGQLKNSTDPDSAEYAFEIENLVVSKADLNKTFKPLIPDSVFTWPQFIRLNGEFNGNTEKLNFNGKIVSDQGTIDIRRLSAGLGEDPHYETNLLVDLKDAGKMVHYDLDRVKFDLNGTFSGKEIHASSAMINLNIDTLSFLKYPYNNLILEGEYSSGKYHAILTSNDPFFELTADLSGIYDETEKYGLLNLDIENLDLKRLNLFKDEFKIEGQTVLNMDIKSITDFETFLELQNLNFYLSDTIYRMHPIQLTGSSNDRNTTLQLESFYYNLDFESEGNWQKLGDGIKNLPRKYLETDLNDTIQDLLPEFTLKGHLEYPEAFARLLFPDLPSFKSLSIGGHYSKATDELYFEIDLPGLKNDSFASDTLLFTLQGNSNELNYSGNILLNINDVLNGEIDISGKIDNSELHSDLRYFDSFRKEYLNISTNVWKDSSGIYLHLNPETLVFSYDNWQIDPENQVRILSEIIDFTNFKIKSGDQSILIASETQNKNNNIRLQLTDFGMGSIENLMALDTLVYGTADADFTFSNVFTNLEINGILSINNMNISDFDFGDFNISKFSYGNDELDYAFSLQGKNEVIQSTGNLNFNPGKESVDIDFNINKIDLKELDYLLAEKVYDPKGNMEANFNITGTTESPMVKGNLVFSDAAVGLKLLNEYFTLGNQSIAVVNNSIRFNDFALTNQQGRSARMNGTFSFDPKTPGKQDLTISTDNMELLNTTENDNKVYYGFLKAQTDIRLTGTSDALKVEAKTKMDKNTKLTYIFPDVLKLNDSKGIVSFDPYNADSVDLNAYKEENEKLKSLALESLKANVEIESGARFKIFFDEIKTDFLDAVLDGNINYIHDGDNSDISGVMSIVEGKLRYSLPMVSVKDYVIKPGSSITISNDIYNPYLNIVASTTVRASTEKLIQDYVKVMNFTVLLKMTGELNNVKLEFDISPETDDVLVSSKLSQLTAQERNVNALNLLVRGSFTLTLKSDLVGSTSSSEAAIDKFYTEQLNHLISENINFVDLSFDVQSFSDIGKYGETEMRRNYYYNVGKSFLNNRARINYKGSFDFSSAEQQSFNTQFVQNELNLEIGLTDDGTWKALFFNRNKYEGILEGRVMETGGGIQLQKSFYSIGDILNGNEEKKANRKQKKEEKNNLKDRESENKE